MNSNKIVTLYLFVEKFPNHFLKKLIIESLKNSNISEKITDDFF